MQAAYGVPRWGRPAPMLKRSESMDGNIGAVRADRDATVCGLQSDSVRIAKRPCADRDVTAALRSDPKRAGLSRVFVAHRAQRYC